MEDLENSVLTRNLIRKTTVMNESGEIVKETSVFIIPRGLDYVKVMTPWKQLSRKLTGAETTVLWYMAYDMNYADGHGGGNEANMVRFHKEFIMSNTGLSMSTINNSLSKMTDYGLLRRLSNGYYQINPFFIGRGRKNALYKLQQEYGVGNKTLADEIAKKELSKLTKGAENYGE